MYIHVYGFRLYSTIHTHIKTCQNENMSLQRDFGDYLFKSSTYNLFMKIVN